MELILHSTEHKLDSDTSQARVVDMTCSSIPPTRQRANGQDDACQNDAHMYLHIITLSLLLNSTIMTTLRSRRPSHASSADEKQPLSIDKEENDVAIKQRSAALSSIKSCYKMAFYSTAVNIWTEFLQPTQHYEMFSLAALFKIVQSLHILGFGVGLFQCVRIYESTSFYRTRTASMPSDKLVDIFKTLRCMWMTSSINLLVGAMAISTQFGDYLDNASLKYGAPLLVLLTAVLIAIIVQTLSRKYAPSKSITDERMEMARKMGYLNLHRMALCLGMLCLDSAVLLLDDILEPNTSIYYKIYTLTSVAEPASVAVLLWTLRQQLCHIIGNEFSSSNNSSSLALVYTQGDLFQAQEGFYTKVADVFKRAATAKLVSPWLPVIKSFILNYKDWCAIENANYIIKWLAKCQ
jgi:hypothetical protein